MSCDGALERNGSPRKKYGNDYPAGGFFEGIILGKYSTTNMGVKRLLSSRVLPGSK